MSQFINGLDLYQERATKTFIWEKHVSSFIEAATYIPVFVCFNEHILIPANAKEQQIVIDYINKHNIKEGVLYPSLSIHKDCTMRTVHWVNKLPSLYDPLY